MAVRAILYDAAGHDREANLEECPLSSLTEDQLLWVDLTVDGENAIKQLPKEMREFAGDLAALGGLEIFDHHYRFSLSLGDKSWLAFIAGNSWLLTVNQKRPEFFDYFIDSDRGETLKGRMTSTALMTALLMRHLDGYRGEISDIDTAIDKLDETILRSREKRAPLRTLAALRRRVSGLRATLGEQRGVVHALVSPDFLAHVDASDHAYLVETNRAYERLEDSVVRARETVIGSFELYTTRVAQDTNQLVKALTIATVITGIVGAVAGIFGMNFDTPVTHSGLTGFLVVTAAMLVTSIAIVAIALWKRWL